MTALPIGDPRRDYPPRPVTDDEPRQNWSTRAVESLVLLRAHVFGDACAELHALLSLAADEVRVPGIVHPSPRPRHPVVGHRPPVRDQRRRNTTPLWGHPWALMPSRVRGCCRLGSWRPRITGISR